MWPEPTRSSLPPLSPRCHDHLLLDSPGARDDPRRRGRHLDPGRKSRPRRRHRRAGAAVGRRSRRHRGRPAAWLPGFTEAAAAAGGLDDVAAIAVGGHRRHGLPPRQRRRRPRCAALERRPLRRGGGRPDPRAGRRRRGGRPAPGPTRWALVPVASFTATKLRWLADAEPGNADRTAAVCLPHDWLTWRLAGRPRLAAWSPTGGTPAAPPTGRRARASTGSTCWSWPCAVVGRRSPGLPGPPRPWAPWGAGRRSWVPGTGDNAAAALGLPPTRATSSSPSARPASSPPSPRPPWPTPTGIVAGFADATGRHLPLVATLNAARVLDAAATLLGVDHDALRPRPVRASGADGLVLVPYLEGERTPNLPAATGSVHGLTLRTATPAYWARATVEGLLAAGRRHRGGVARGSPCERVLLVGGAARSRRPAAGAGHLRPAGAGAAGRRIRRRRRGPPGRVGAVGGRAPPDWAQPGLPALEAAPTPRCARATRRCAAARTASLNGKQRARSGPAGPPADCVADRSGPARGRPAEMGEWIHYDDITSARPRR